MATLKAHDLENRIAKPQSLAKAMLIYGPDEGRVGELAGRVAAAFANASDPPGDVIRLDDSDLQEEPDRLIVELRTVPMFGGPPAVRLKAGARLRPDLVTALLELEDAAGMVVVEAGALKRDAKLRKLFEGAPNAWAIACYGDEGRDIERLIDEVLLASSVDISRDARAYLRDHLGANRQLSRNELEKLALYAGPGSSVDTSDIDAIVGDASAQAIDRVVMAAAEGAARKALAEYDRTLAAGQTGQSVLIGLQRHLSRLHQVQSALGAGKSPDVAFRSLRPPVHFSQKRQFEDQLRRWPIKRLEGAVSRVQRTIAKCRSASVLENGLIGALFIELAIEMRGRGK